jgi:SAM-dependent methyltransferase
VGIIANVLASSIGQPLGQVIHARALGRQERSQSLATSLFRNVLQLSALEGPLGDLPAKGHMQVLVAGCSIGCEAYTLAGYLASRFPALDIVIKAFDIDPDAVEHARAGIYSSQYVNDTVFCSPFADVARTLLSPAGRDWSIRPEIARHVSFAVDDALVERPQDTARFDLVLAQNFMVHMDDTRAGRALRAMSACVRSGGAMLLGGMTLDMRAGATSSVGLAPVDWNIRAIHDEDTVRRNAWPFAYWSLEPLDDSRHDWKARYSTVFRKMQSSAMTTNSADNPAL